MNYTKADVFIQTLGDLSSPAETTTFDVNGEMVNARTLGMRLSNSALADIVEQGSEHLVSNARAVMVPPNDTDALEVYSGFVPPKITGPVLTYLLSAFAPVEIDARHALINAKYIASLRVPMDSEDDFNEVSDKIVARISENITNASSLVASVSDIQQTVEDSTRILTTDIFLDVAYLAVERQTGETFAQSQSLPAVLVFCSGRGSDQSQYDSYGLKSAGGRIYIDRGWRALSIAKVGGDVTEIAEELRRIMLIQTLSDAVYHLRLLDGAPVEGAANLEIWGDTYRDTFGLDILPD